MENNTIRLTLEDGKEVVCEVISIFSIKDQEYIGILEPDEEHVLLYRFFEDKEGPVLTQIESDEEFAAVEAAFREMEEHHHHDHDHENCCGHDHEKDDCCGDDNENGGCCS